MGITYLPLPARAARAEAYRNPALSWIERVAAGAMLIASAPVLVPAMAAVRSLSGQSPLVAHRRVGLLGSPIWVLKVRTMWNARRHNTPRWVERLYDTTVPRSKQASDPRVTSRFASFLRRHSIDELPQLWHVVRGQMRLVGPRPMTAAEIDEYYESAAPEVLSVPPGVTGLWQVMGRSRLTYPQRRRLDLFYVRRASWRLYFRILARTCVEVLTGRNAC